MTISVMTVGDVFADAGNGRSAFRSLEPLFATGDIVFGNCEGVYCDRPEKSPSHKHYMGTSMDRGSFFGEVGFDVMSCANNHMLDGGYVGLEDTQELLRGQGIAVTGAGENVEEVRRPAVIERDGVRVAFLGVCSVFPKGYEARPGRPGISALRVTSSYLDPDENFWEPGIAPQIVTRAERGDLDGLLAAIESAKSEADVVVVAPHWGYSSRLVLLHDYELELAREMIDAGADAVTCAHHHSLRGIEFHRGRPIFYGLGALVHHFQDSAVSPEMRADRDCKFGKYSSFKLPKEEFRLFPFAEDARKTMVATLDVDAAGGNVAVGYFPAAMLADGSTEPLPAGSERAAGALAYMQEISGELGFSTRFELSEREGWAFVDVRDAE